MKNNQKWVLALSSILILVATSCLEKPKEEKEKHEQEEEITKAPEGIITLAEADTLYVNYTKNRADAILEFETNRQEEEEAKPFIPSRFVSFNVKDLKSYIAYVEKKAKAGGTEVDSLRVYLGNYGTKKKGWKKKNRNTVFFVPAAQVDGDYGGIYIGADGSAKLLYDYWSNEIKSQKSKASILPSLNTLFYQDESLILNEGGLSPPPKTDF
ncbi:hypothetical protein ACFSQJ_03385 [Croceitalea marina]|uniref:Lipoprotein n=1 Tax=Croceitalea marina TaxID=1775166 RepID=A0ABW5MRQ5_9FLAO